MEAEEFREQLTDLISWPKDIIVGRSDENVIESIKASGWEFRWKD